MNKEEILKKARSENNGVDEVERSAQARATIISQAAGLCACMLFSFMDNVFLETGVVDSVCWILYGIMVSSNLWVRASILKKKGYFIGAALTTVFVILLSVFFFLGES